MERTHTTKTATKREQEVDEVKVTEQDTDLLDDIDAMLDDIDEVLEETVVRDIMARHEMANVEEVVCASRAEQRSEDSEALWALGLYSPQDLTDSLLKELNPECKLCGRCPVHPACAEDGL